MDARNPVCRSALLAAALVAAIGCQSSGAGPRARGQMPQDPLAPVAPPPPPDLTNTLPVTPAQGIVTATAGGPVPGAPVPAAAKGPVVNAGYTGTKGVASAAELLKKGVPRVKVVAVVGANNVITDQEVIEAVWQQFAGDPELAVLQGHEREEKVREMYSIAQRKTIERELILDDQYAKLKKANKMSMADELRERSAQRADSQIREMKKRTMSKSDEEFSAFLRIQGLTLPVLRRQSERQFMAQSYLEEVLRGKARRAGLAEIRDYYDRHPEEFRTPDRVKWQHVFVSLAKHPTPQAAYEYAEAVRKSAEAGGDFAELAKKYDEGFAKMQNGFGTGELRDKIQPPDLEQTVWSLKPGQMSGLLQTATGYHLVKVVEREVAGVKPFDATVQGKIRDKLNDALLAAESKRLMDELWRRGVVRVMEE
jgi:parvulin-like peptidyl-prolyl isomerase